MLRRVTIVLASLTLATAALFLTTTYTCRHFAPPASGSVIQDFTTRTVLQTLHHAATASAIVTALAGIIGLNVVRARGATTTLFALFSIIGAILLLPFLYGVFIWTSMFGCFLADEISLPDGRSYCMTSSSYLIGDTLTIGRSGANYGLFRDMNALGNVGTDSPIPWATVIRPAGIDDDAFAQLHMSESGLLVGFACSCECYLAYDTAEDRFYGLDDAEHISPFVLIGPATKMHQGDVEDLLQREKTGPQEAPAPGCTTDESLTEALDHPNPAVRDLARQVLDIRKNRETPASM